MRHSPPAYSLIFAFLVMTVILIIATTTVQNTNEKIVYFREMEGSTQAKLAAESATEQAILAMKDYNAGYSIDLTEEVFQADNNDDGTYETWSNYTVYSSAQTNDTDSTGYFYTPIPGTGTAGDPDDCSILNDDEDVDHPCNWNKLMYGQSVTIPLYTDDGSGGILTPADFSSFTGWYLKVRTPCKNGDLDDPDCVRFEFDGDGTDVVSDPNDDDSSVVFWQLVGEDVDGNSVSLLPDDTKLSSYGMLQRVTTVNTEIYEDRLNDAYSSSGDYFVLKGINTAPYKEIYQVCTETHSNFTDGTWGDLSTLSLQLNIVTPLIDADGLSIPYLEWQMATEASQAFADTKAVITGEGYYKGSNKTFYYPFVVTRSTTGESTSVYTLSN